MPSWSFEHDIEGGGNNVFVGPGPQRKRAVFEEAFLPMEKKSDLDMVLWPAGETGLHKGG